MTTQQLNRDFSLEMKQDIDRYAAHMTDLISRLDAARDEVIKRDRRIEQLERENAELREKCVEVN